MKADRCREMWWHHLFFVNNFGFWSDCMPQAWHLAMDFQVYILCSVIMLWILSRGLDPEYVLKRLLAASLLLLFTIVYLFELSPQLLTVNPENILTLFAEDTSHVYLYMSAWGNLPAAVLGLLLASTYYRLQREKTDLTQNKNLKKAFRLRESNYNIIINFVGPATSILCWPGWRVLSRLSLTSLMTHVLVNAQITYSRIHNSVSQTQMLADAAAVSVISYLLALPLALLIEYPAVQLYKAVIVTGLEEETKNHTSAKGKQL
ncbi:hypothetical protein EVAR_46807_1 [Eumeta japonica]|uniref:Nose resistant to fluoxetine protein 6 n=1 Tax=Eumeta variegata TaxID=151549 RepID=A0A4C1XG19_EUMVA|nr:hypothetical protein EVAR_46807_1 [Eumeta japonica]